jgi:hypothetical protein
VRQDLGERGAHGFGDVHVTRTSGLRSG